jgi:hypothetical protein
MKPFSGAKPDPYGYCGQFGKRTARAQDKFIVRERTAEDHMGGEYNPDERGQVQ